MEVIAWIWNAGVSKLNRAELEAACEDFSNILDTFPGCKVYKGTLSSGVEIAVASTTIASSKEWSRHAEVAFKKRVIILEHFLIKIYKLIAK